MASSAPPKPSNTRVDKAGALLRDWWQDMAIPTDEKVSVDLNLLWTFRAGVATPLKKTTVGVRQFVDRESTHALDG